MQVLSRRYQAIVSGWDALDYAWHNTLRVDAPRQAGGSVLRLLVTEETEREGRIVE